LAFKFFKDKNKGPIEVTCPLCQHVQQESPLAVSSTCKGCNAYLSFRKGGEIVARRQPSNEPLSQNSQTSEPKPKPELTQKPEPKPAPKPEPKPELKSQEDLSPRYHRQSNSDDEESKSAQKKRKANERLVTCFECGDSHIANALSNSTQCRKCGRLISLEDKEIKETVTSRIQTRGNVHIHKKGIVLGASIQCHNLIVDGDFTGNVECSGDLTLRRHGKIAGTVVCDRLFVQKRAKIEFMHSVETNECQIDGLVSGNLVCRGRLALEKRATLTGDIKVKTLTVADGAKHHGKIQMGGF